VREAAAVGGDQLLVEWRDRAAFARDLGGDALKDLRRQMRIDQNREFRLAQHIDKARSNDETLRVNHAAALRIGERADLRDAPVGDADVAGIPWRASAVDNVAVANDEIKLLGCVQARGDNRKRNEGEEFGCQTRII